MPALWRGDDSRKGRAHHETGVLGVLQVGLRGGERSGIGDSPRDAIRRQDDLRQETRFASRKPNGKLEPKKREASASDIYSLLLRRFVSCDFASRLPIDPLPTHRPSVLKFSDGSPPSRIAVRGNQLYDIPSLAKRGRAREGGATRGPVHEQDAEYLSRRTQRERTMKQYRSPCTNSQGAVLHS